MGVPEAEDAGPIPIDLGGYRATISAPAAVAVAFRSMLADVITRRRGPRDASIVVRSVEGRFRIWVDHRLWEPGPDQTVCDQLMYALMRATLDAEPDLLHVHVAYVASAGRGVLIAGNPGSGKSTLVARLIGAGFDYLTDERVGVGRELQLCPLPKPVSLVESSFSVLSHLDPSRTGKGVSSARLWHIPASAIRPDSAVRSASPAVVAFVRYEPGATASLGDVHPAEATRLLLGDSMDAVRFGPAAIEVTAELCASLRCTRLLFGDGDDVIALLRRVAAPPPASPTAVEPLPPTRPRRAGLGTSAGPPAAAWVPAPRPDVSGVIVAGRAVLGRSTTGEIMELDESSTAWWRLLDGRVSLGDLAREVADENGLPAAQVLDMAVDVVGRLATMGLVG